ncbi:MAG: glycosyltransferase [Planctomycetota bacterium]
MNSQRPLTILQVLPALNGGGVERGVLEIAEAITKAGHRSLVISAGGRMVDALTGSGTRHFECRIGVKSPLTLRHVPWLRRFLVEQRVDVVDVHSRLPAWIMWFAWKSLLPSRRPALISTVHGLYSPGSYSSIMCRGQHVVAVSESVHRYIRTHYPFVPKDRLHVIHRGIDPAEFPRGFEASMAWRDKFFRLHPNAAGKPILTLPGRLTRLKGHTSFLALMARLKQLGVICHGLIVGGVDRKKTAYESELRELSRQLELSQHITFLGDRTDMRELYAISSIVLSLSTKPEAFGRTVAEALSIGTPVVGYSLGGVDEILQTIFPSGALTHGDIDALVSAVTTLLNRSEVPRPLPGELSLHTMQRRTVQLYELASRR